MSPKVGQKPRTAAQRAQAARNQPAARKPESRGAPQGGGARRADTFEQRRAQGPDLSGVGAPKPKKTTQERIEAYTDKQLAKREKKVKKGLKKAVKLKHKKQAARLKAELKLIDREQAKRLKEKIRREVENISVGFDTKSQAWQTLDDLSPEELASLQSAAELAGPDLGSVDFEEVQNASEPEWTPLSDAELDTWLKDNGFATAESVSDADLAAWDQEADQSSLFASIFDAF